MNDIPLWYINPEWIKTENYSIMYHWSGLHIPLRPVNMILWFYTMKYTLRKVESDEYCIYVITTSENKCSFYDEVVSREKYFIRGYLDSYILQERNINTSGIYIISQPLQTDTMFRKWFIIFKLKILSWYQENLYQRYN